MFLWPPGSIFTCHFVPPLRWRPFVTVTTQDWRPMIGWPLKSSFPKPFSAHVTRTDLGETHKRRKAASHPDVTPSLAFSVLSYWKKSADEWTMTYLPYCWALLAFKRFSNCDRRAGASLESISHTSNHIRDQNIKWDFNIRGSSALKWTRVFDALWPAIQSGSTSFRWGNSFALRDLE